MYAKSRKRGYHLHFYQVQINLTSKCEGFAFEDSNWKFKKLNPSANSMPFNVNVSKGCEERNIVFNFGLDLKIWATMQICSIEQDVCQEGIYYLMIYQFLHKNINTL